MDQDQIDVGMTVLVVKEDTVTSKALIRRPGGVKMDLRQKAQRSLSQRDQHPKSNQPELNCCYYEEHKRRRNPIFLLFFLDRDVLSEGSLEKLSGVRMGN